MEGYRHSRYREYLNGANVADTIFSLAMVRRNEWICLHNIFQEKIGVSIKIPMNDEQIRRKIQFIIDGRKSYEMAS